MAFDIGDKYGDSRDIINRISELDSEIYDCKEEIEELDGEISDLQDEIDNVEDMTEEEIKKNQDEIKEAEKNIESLKANLSDLEKEFKQLDDFEDEFQGYCDNWKYGATLIHDDYFVDYIKNDLVPDLFSEMRDLPSWLANNIDWDGVAEDFKVDFTSGEIDGNTYWCL